MDESGNDEARDAENAISEPKGHELVYAAHVSLDHEQITSHSITNKCRWMTD